ncbi:MAG: transcription elongation factor GreA [Chloroflexi bacterium]|nr:transcription elongation factor GreA [Chloroflexota bacterium]
MAEKVNFLTAEGRVKLEQELNHLRDVRRIEVAESLKAAVEEGDLTENAGYDETKREQAFIEGRIRELEAILANARVLTGAAKTDVILLGASVTVAEDNYAPETYQIVGRTEADPVKGRISNESPLGKALLGKRTGDLVRVDTPGGTTHFKVLAIQ